MHNLLDQGNNTVKHKKGRLTNVDEHNEVKTRGDYELGTFEFLKTGWWVWHVIAIVGIFYLGYLFGGSLFR